MGYHIHEQLYRISSADCIFGITQIFGETFNILFFNKFHSLLIHILDEFPYFPFAIERLEIEMVTPMTKITWNDENCVFVIEIRR